MNPRVVYALSNETLPTIATRIFRTGFSQLPVKEHKEIIGQVTEGIFQIWLSATAIMDFANTTNTNQTRYKA